MSTYWRPSISTVMTITILIEIENDIAQKDHIRYNICIVCQTRSYDTFHVSILKLLKLPTCCTTHVTIIFWEIVSNQVPRSVIPTIYCVVYGTLNNEEKSIMPDNVN